MPALINPFRFGIPSVPGTFDWLGDVELGIVDDSIVTTGSTTLGVAHATRLIVGVVHWTYSGPSDWNQLSSAYIGGGVATILAQDTHSGGSTGVGCAVVSRAIPTGTSASMQFGFNDPTIIGGAVSLFRATNLVSNSPHDILVVQGPGDIDINGLINVPSNGALLIGGQGSTNTAGFPITFTGATERYDANAGGGRAGAASITGLAQETNRFCRFNIPGASDSGTEMIACSWQLGV